MSTEIQERPVFIAASIKLPEPPHRLRAVPPKAIEEATSHSWLVAFHSDLHAKIKAKLISI